jgi:midasin (ATPase involved in ribosome maturation)
MPMALWGHTSVGKSEGIKAFAALIQAPIYRINFHGMTTSDDIIGKLLPVGEGRIEFQDGGVTECVRQGGILMMEELNAASQEVHFALHGLFDGFGSLVLVEKDNEIVHKHPQCRIFSTMNPSEFTSLYPGTKDLSQAFSGRWPIFRHVDFLPENLEIKIIQEHAPQTSKADIIQMVKVAKIARKFLVENKLQFVFSTRTLKNWAQLTPKFGMLRAAEMCFLGHMDSSARAKMITEILDSATTLDIKYLKAKYVN